MGNLQLNLPPKHEDPIEQNDLIANLVEGVRILQRAVSSLKKNATASYTYPEYASLSSTERGLISKPVELCIGNLRNLVNASTFVDFETFYSKVYSVIPSSMVAEMTNAMDSYWNSRSKLFGDDDVTYEKIMKKFMDMSADMAEVPWYIESLVSGGGKIYDTVIKLLNKFTQSKHNTLDWDLFPIKPALLALLWAILLMELTAKYTRLCTRDEKARIAKISISIVLALFAGFTGYMHSGGYTGAPSVTSWVRTLYNARKLVEYDHPYYSNMIPEFVKFYDCSEFDDLAKSMQITAAKGLNMVYTFRVGDSFLENLLGSKICSEDVLKRTFKAVWPLPNTEESKKIYRLYTEDKIYNL